MTQAQLKALLNCAKVLIDLQNFALATEIMNYVEANAQQTNDDKPLTIKTPGQKASDSPSAPVSE